MLEGRPDRKAWCCFVVSGLSVQVFLFGLRPGKGGGVASLAWQLSLGDGRPPERLTCSSNGRRSQVLVLRSLCLPSSGASFRAGNDAMRSAVTFPMMHQLV